MGKQKTPKTTTQTFSDPTYSHEALWSGGLGPTVLFWFCWFLVFAKVLHRARPARADPEGPTRRGGARADGGGRCGGSPHHCITASGMPAPSGQRERPRGSTPRPCEGAFAVNHAPIPTPWDILLVSGVIDGFQRPPHDALSGRRSAKFSKPSSVRLSKLSSAHLGTAKMNSVQFWPSKQS